jgi:hypothetical protein
MAIRARIKSKIKSLLFGSSTSTKSTVATPPSTQQPAFESPVVSTQATQTTIPKTDAKSTPVTSKVDSAADNSGARASKGVPEDASAQENEGLTEEDTTEAAFIVEVTELFPATCPHCDTSTDNNWTRIENKFACSSCCTAY